tara:strand:+ start:663 stop:854 length:192 start_codon:yes stop_codon:yes gene_type:complete
MIAKEKAMDIAMKFDKYGQTDNAVKCVLICVDEILESLWNVGHSSSNDEIKYWQEVKEEINKL